MCLEVKLILQHEVKASWNLKKETVNGSATMVLLELAFGYSLIACLMSRIW
jgi:hypothetical protein